MTARRLAAALVFALANLGPLAAAAETGPADPTHVQPPAPEVRRLYALAGETPLWTSQREDQLRQAFAQAVRHGLSPELPRPSEGLDPLARDRRLSRAALDYAQALARGVVDPAAVHAIFTLDRNRPDLAAGLAAALGEGRVASWFESLAPQDAEYRSLSAAYLQERNAIGRPRGARVPDGPLLRPGDRDRRVPALAAALRRAGHGAADPAGTVYTAEMAEAVRALQRRAGLAIDGVVGPDTLEVLNAGPFERARQLAVNLERRRWLARDPESRRIDVNIAAAQMTYYRHARPEWRGRVVAGAVGHETPQLGERFDRLVLNPPWYVPRSIAEAEILPRGDGYLAAHDMYVADGRVVQRPGPRAALGRVKFDMQNPYAIYLHDTPAKALFETSARHRSHGCVRVEDAIAFARRLAAAEGREAAFDAQLASGETGVFELSRPVAVRLLYHTAFVAGGEVRLRPDVYGWDDAVAERLGLGRGERRTRAAATVLLGP